MDQEQLNPNVEKSVILWQTSQTSTLPFTSLVFV